MNRVDITYSVLLENAALDYQAATKRIMEEYKIPIDMAEIAMEKALMELKNEKMKLYATAIYSDFQHRKEGAVDGN
ncbi:MAG: hypothetical protein K1W10_02375 [Lachnospiraceae bacterium]